MLAYHKPGSEEARREIHQLALVVQDLLNQDTDIWFFESPPPKRIPEIVFVLSLAPGGHYDNTVKLFSSYGSRVLGPIPKWLISLHIVRLFDNETIKNCKEVYIVYWPSKRFFKIHKSWLSESINIAKKYLDKKLIIVDSFSISSLNNRPDCMITLTVSSSSLVGKLRSMYPDIMVFDGSLLSLSWDIIASWILLEYTCL